MIKKVVFCTLRNNKGATGGPGGVLFMLKEYINSPQDELLQFQYRFNTISKNLKGCAYYLNRLFFILRVIFEKNVYYITHDIDSAYLLSRLHKKYSLVYHQQGPLVQELKNFGNNLSPDKIKKIQYKEKEAFTKAYSIHFPSHGAEMMYFTNKYKACTSDKVNIGVPLYNTIPHSNIKRVNNIKEDKDVLTFFSLGTLTHAKGQDNVINFFKQYMPLTSRQIRYIIVGNGPLKTLLLEKCEELSHDFSNFTYHYFERLEHEEVMFLHKISDIYIMMHRLSIFDFATLEAMSQDNAIILSNIGGNLDFNKKDNIIYVDNNNYKKAIKEFQERDLNTLKRINKEVYNEYFSINAFKRNYLGLIHYNLKKLNNENA